MNPQNSERHNEKDHKNQAVGSESLLIHAMSMALGTMSSRILGLVRDQLFASMFPMAVKDAWTAAFRLPNLFRRILGEGSLSVSFIPVFVQTRHDDPTHLRSQNLVNSFYTMLLVILSLLTAVGTFFPELLLNLVLDPSFVADAAKYELTVRMSKIMFCFIFFMSTYAYFMGILNALGKYGLAAMAPTLFNISMIVANFVPQDILPTRGDALAWGVVVGGILQMGILIPSLKSANYLPKLKFDFKNSDSLMVFKNMIPGLLGLGLSQITTIINLRFASSLPEGSITYIYLADRLLELPLSLVSVSLGVALLPTLSKLWAEKNNSKMLETGNYYLRLNLFVAIPAAIGLYLLSVPIVKILFERGEFTSIDTLVTAGVVQIYCSILIVTSCVRVLVPSFYAIKNTWVPAFISAVCLVAHVVIAPLLMKAFGLNGLVASNFFSSALNLILLIVLFYKYLGNFALLKILKSSAKFSIAAIMMGFTVKVYEPIRDVLIQAFQVVLLSEITSLFLTISLAACVYIGIAYALKCEELQVTLGTLVAKVRRRLGR